MKKSISGWLVAIAMATLSVSAVAHASAEKNEWRVCRRQSRCELSACERSKSGVLRH